MPKHKTSKLNEVEIAAEIARHIDRAINNEEEELADVRIDIFDRYYGRRTGDETPGYSQYTTREVLEAVEWAHPAILKVFLGSDKVVNFEATGPEDEGVADQETDVVNYMVRRANGGDGFLALYNFTKDALMYPTAYAKAYMDEEEKETTHRVSGVPAEGLSMLMEREGVEIVAQDSEVVMTELGPMEVFDVEYVERVTKKTLRMDSIPAEEMLISRELTSLNLDKSDFLNNRTLRNFSELVREGFDQDKLSDIGSELSRTDADWNEERVARLFYEDESPEGFDAGNRPEMRKYWVNDCYLWIDTEGTGLAQYRHIILIGDKVFLNEEVDMQPFVAMSAIPIPHKHNGLSLAQTVIDVQRLLTSLTRQLLDNVYRINVGRKFISANAFMVDGSTEEALDDRNSEYVPVDGRAADAVYPDLQQPVIADILPVIQHAMASTSMRTGIAPENNIDPNVLQQTTAGAFTGAMEKAGERLEMMIRIMAETGIKQLFRKFHALIRANPDIARSIKLSGQWVPVDPGSWVERDDIKVNVGLGLNSKHALGALLQQVMAMQLQLQPMGLAGPKELYETARKTIEMQGLGAPENFFIDPDSEAYQPPEPQPDPALMLAQGEIEAKNKEADTNQFEAQAAAEVAKEKVRQAGLKLQADIEREAAKLEMEAALQEPEPENTRADTEYKRAQTEKAMADAAAARRPDPKPTNTGS